MSDRLSCNRLVVDMVLCLCRAGQVGDDTLPSSGSQPLSPRNSLVLTAPVFIKKGDKGFGFHFKAVRVYIGESDNYRLHHIVEVCV